MYNGRVTNVKTHQRLDTKKLLLLHETPGVLNRQFYYAGVSTRASRAHIYKIVIYGLYRIMPMVFNLSMRHTSSPTQCSRHTNPYNM
jgi:hypothetical protein